MLVHNLWLSIILLFGALIFCNLKVEAQQQLTHEQIDSLFTKFLQIRAPQLLSESQRLVTITPADRKCGFRLVGEIKNNFENFSTEQKDILSKILSRPDKQKSTISPSGVFRIHYDTTGTEIPGYNPSLSVEENVMLVAEALDYSYNFEVGTLGYPVPPSDNGSGGDDKYDVYIASTGSYYGWTEWESKVGSTNWTSFMVIHNNYSGFFSSGIDGAKVTVAHEFHHGIQVGNYGILNGTAPYRDEDIYFYEITSTSMEEFVYDDVNDYYAYLPEYFNNPEVAFPNHIGYDLAHWNIFLVNNFGYDIIKQQLQLVENQRAINAINNSIINNGSNFPYQLNEFGIWTYFTGSRSIPGQYFEEAENYPLIVPLSVVSFTPPSQTVQVDAQATSNNFIRFNVVTNGDVLYAIVTNGDVNSASPNQNPLFGFDYALFSDSASGERKLTENYSSTFSVNSPTLWSVTEILNDQIVFQDSTPTPVPGSISYSYPNPFFYNRNYLTGSLIFFPLDANVGEKADLNIYTSGMQLVYSRTEDISNLPGSQKGISWHVLDDDGEKPASGVYIYVIKKGNDILKGKVVIFNE